MKDWKAMVPVIGALGGGVLLMLIISVLTADWLMNRVNWAWVWQNPVESSFLFAVAGHGVQHPDGLCPVSPSLVLPRAGDV